MEKGEKEGGRERDPDYKGTKDRKCLHPPTNLISTKQRAKEGESREK